mmetsp:Transcript_60976/g.176502  ORF Transcript_60976/g.176502 Transcript_60976/m.176502 type:complete len:327 (-) Transcript_60976:7-987(-)
MLLHRDVREVLSQVGHVAFVPRVPGHGEAAEPAPMHVDRQGLVACDHNVESHVELFVADQQGFVDVLLHDVQLLALFGVVVVLQVLVVLRRLPICGRPPLLHLRQLVHQEDASPLRPPDGLHDPCRAGVPLELLDEHVVLRRHYECDRVHIVLARLLGLPILLALPLHALHVLDEEVLPSQLVVVEEVVHMLVRIQVDLLVSLVDPVLVRPEDVPVGLGIGLLPAPGLQHVVDGVELVGGGVRASRGGLVQLRAPEPDERGGRRVSVHEPPEVLRHATGHTQPRTSLWAPGGMDTSAELPAVTTRQTPGHRSPGRTALNPALRDMA